MNSDYDVQLDDDTKAVRPVVSSEQPIRIRKGIPKKKKKKKKNNNKIIKKKKKKK